jgi:hypothetical protein
VVATLRLQVTKVSLRKILKDRTRLDLARPNPPNRRFDCRSAKLNDEPFGKPLAQSPIVRQWIAPDEEEREMQYRLEIYAQGRGNEDECIKVFTSTAPFAPLHAGDLVNASTWGYDGAKFLRISSVEHAIVEKSLGIDPSGRIINRTLIHTEGILDSVRHQAPVASSPD